MHHVRYKSKNNEKENMKEEKIPCRIIRYREFPDLLFGTLREDGPVYFDATRFIQAKGDARRHNVRDFRVAFHHWATALADAYGIDREKMIIRDEASGHLLIDEILEDFYNLFIYKRFEGKDKIEVTNWQPCLFLRFAVSCYQCHSS